jgi:hypothetical protein
MYVKVFESRQTSNSYIVQHDISMRGLDHGVMYLENQDKKRIKICENELFRLLDFYFRVKTDERQNEESRQDDGQENKRIRKERC